MVIKLHALRARNQRYFIDREFISDFLLVLMHLLERQERESRFCLIVLVCLWSKRSSFDSERWRSKSEVTAIFSIKKIARYVNFEEADIPKSEELILRRVNFSDGRKLAWVNEKRVSSDFLDF